MVDFLMDRYSETSAKHYIVTLLYCAPLFLSLWIIKGQQILWGKGFQVPTNVGNVELRKRSQFLSLQDFSVSLTYSYILQLLKAHVLTHPSVCVGRGGIDATVPQLMITKPHCRGASPKSKVSQNIFWQMLRFTENSHYWLLFLIFNIKQFLQDALFVKVLATGERGKA